MKLCAGSNCLNAVYRILLVVLVVRTVGAAARVCSLRASEDSMSSGPCSVASKIL